MDDIDFSLILHKHGWATFLLNIDRKVYEIEISATLSDPFYDFANLLLSLLNNEEEVTIKWLGEPGGTKLHIVRNKIRHHLLDVKIIDFDYDIASGAMTNESERLSFEIKQKQLLTIGFYQLKKTYHLLQEQSFAKERKGEFPYALFDKLTKRIAARLPDLF